MLELKQIDELNFWKGIKNNGIRGFSPDEWRIAHIHFKQYSLMYINRDIGNLENKVVVEVGCGPAGIITHTSAARAVGVDQLMDEYQEMWDLYHDNVDYICSEIETFDLPLKADVVICWNVLDHVRDINKALKKISNLLKDDGELWLMINLEDASGSWKIVKKSSRANTGHPYQVNEVSALRFLRKHGFEWKEKVIMRNCLSRKNSILMGVLIKNYNAKKGLLFKEGLSLIRLKADLLCSKLGRSIRR